MSRYKCQCGYVSRKAEERDLHAKICGHKAHCHQRLVMALSPLQERLVEILNTKCLNRIGTISELSAHARINRLAISSAMRSLEKRKMAISFAMPNGDQWSGQHWALSDELKRHNK